MAIYGPSPAALLTAELGATASTTRYLADRACRLLLELSISMRDMTSVRPLSNTDPFPRGLTSEIDVSSSVNRCGEVSIFSDLRRGESAYRRSHPISRGKKPGSGDILARIVLDLAHQWLPKNVRRSRSVILALHPSVTRRR